MKQHNTKENMKTVGIIGGFGPKATSEFYLRLVTEFRKNHNGQQPHIIIENVAVPRALEHELLIEGKSDNFAPLLVTAAQTLKRNGADIIVLPCNTLHVHEDKIRRSVALPFVSIIEETVRFLTAHNITQVGFLGTCVTIKENLFKKKTDGVRFITVPEDLQQQIDIGVDQFIEKQQLEILTSALQHAFLLFEKQGLKDVLVACTDFHGLCATTLKSHDTLDILVRATAKNMKGGENI